jgi:hypothetical protein
MMATPISIANIARVSVGVVSMIWALLGLGDAFAAAMGHGIDALVAAALAVNLALVLGAVMAFASASRWRAVVIGAMALVTAERLVYVLGTGDYLLALSSVVMLAAVIGICAVARSQ